MSITENLVADNTPTRVIEVGPNAVRYRVFTATDLGVVPNPNMWIGNGWFHCVGCRAYQYHDAYSHPGMSDCFEVCRVCQRYYRAEAQERAR